MRDPLSQIGPIIARPFHLIQTTPPKLRGRNSALSPSIELFLYILHPIWHVSKTFIRSTDRGQYSDQFHPANARIHSIRTRHSEVEHDPIERPISRVGCQTCTTTVYDLELTTFSLITFIHLRQGRHGPSKGRSRKSHTNCPGLRTLQETKTKSMSHHPNSYLTPVFIYICII